MNKYKIKNYSLSYSKNAVEILARQAEVIGETRKEAIGEIGKDVIGKIRKDVIGGIRKEVDMSWDINRTLDFKQPMEINLIMWITQGRDISNIVDMEHKAWKIRGEVWETINITLN